MCASIARVSVLLCALAPALRPQTQELQLIDAIEVARPFLLLGAASESESIRVHTIRPDGQQPQLEWQSTTISRVYRVTAYCDRGFTAAGTLAGVGQCAAPADIPFGSRVYIPELGRTFIVTDRTARRFRHNTVDIFLPDREACLRFGRSYLECQITFPKTAPRYGSAELRAAVQAHASAEHALASRRLSADG